MICRSHLSLAGLTAAALLLAAPRATPARAMAAPAAAPVPPNIVLILTDDQDLTLGSMDSMPHTRELVGDRGMTFTHYFVPLSLCCPSRATLLRGEYAHNHKIYSNQNVDGGYRSFHRYGHESSTIGTALHDAGYRTALLGKYLNQFPSGVDRSFVPPGWDEWDVPVAGGAYGGSNYVLSENGVQVRYGEDPSSYLTDVLLGRATRFLDAAAAAGKPFFLYFAPYAPHVPARPAPRHAALFQDVRAPRTPSWNEEDVRDKPAAVRALAPLTAADVAGIDELYRNRLRSLQAVDEAVAALVEQLRRLGQLDNTYIFFTSDNGYHMGQHRLRPGKYTPYETDIRVPMLVRGPGVPAGTSTDALASEVDLAPTLAALAGTAMHHPVDGRSWVPILSGGAVPADWRRVVLLEQFLTEETEIGEGDVLEPSDPAHRKALTTIFRHRGLRTATAKYVEYSSRSREYYDLDVDPDELQNQIGAVPVSLRIKLSVLARRLSNCAGDSCRSLESAPLPAAGSVTP